MSSVTTRTNIFGRLKNSIGGIGIGLLLFVVAFPLLFINEGRAVKTAEALTEGAAAVVSIDATNTSAASDGDLVHFTGEATTEEVLRDSLFGANAQALRMIRTVEMFQWKETSKTTEQEKLSGSVETTTTYSYSKEWSSSHNDSSRFHESATHQNPPSIPYGEERHVAERITVGAFTLGDNFRQRVGTTQALPVQPEWLNELPEELRERAQVHDGAFFVGTNPQSPEIGDLRIRFEAAPPAVVSLIGRKSADKLEDYTASNGRTIALVTQGTETAESMFEAAQASNRMMTWILRFVGFLMMFIGISMVLKPMRIMASIVPLFGKIAGAGIKAVAFAAAAPLSLFTIALGWVFYRPLIGILLFIVGGAILVGLFMLIKNAKAVDPEAASA